MSSSPKVASFSQYRECFDFLEETMMFPLYSLSFTAPLQVFMDSLTKASRDSLSGVNQSSYLQGEDGIRDWSVTGVQTCALPIRSEEHTSELQSLTNLVCRLCLSSSS